MQFTAIWLHFREYKLPKVHIQQSEMILVRFAMQVSAKTGQLLPSSQEPHNYN